MRYTAKLLKMLVLFVLVMAAIYYVPGNKVLIRTYERAIFYPFQSLRGKCFGRLPFSLGDILYLAGGVWLLATLIKWIVYLFHFSSDKNKLGLSILSVINTILWVYLLFLIGWGINYYKPPLKEYWGLQQNPADTAWKHDINLRRQLRAKDSLALIGFDSFLVERLNNYAPHYRHMSLSEINERARSYYGRYTDSRVRPGGFGIKPTLFGYFMIRLGIEGYYNPFTGEGQIDKNLPAFMMPYLVCHEMAHQTGIAAEDDANLVAYALCTASEDSTFRYSSYLDIWLYTNYRLYYRDSASAKRFESELNKLTTAHIDTMDRLSQLYENQFAHYSSKIYDNYLKLQDQKEGIRSYGNVSSSAWKLEQQRMQGKTGLISLP